MAESTRSSIDIAADAATIMGVIADLERYPEWSSEVRGVEVLDKAPDGRPVRARFVIESGLIKDTYELRYAWDGDSAVSWELVRATLLKALDGRYEICALPESGCRVTYQLRVDLTMPMLGMIKRRAEKVIVDTALGGLRDRVESGG